MYVTRLKASIVLTVCSLLICQGQDIKLVNNGYEDVLVAISETVQYDPQLIPRIQTVLNEASAALYSATKYRAHLRKVTILIPSSWPTSAALAKSETFDKANIRIDIPSAQYGDNPWVKQTAGCGEPGEYMHLTPEFLTNVATSEKKWGSLAKVFVHEWGHLRWGLFDEYPTGSDIKEHFYFSPTTNLLEASRCNLNVQGIHRHRVTGDKCQFDATISLPEADCRFYPNPAITKATSSLMYYHFLPSVSEFCDDNEYDLDNYHNVEAPSQHNRLCEGKSAWTIMRESEDFKNGKNQGTDNADLNTTVSFNLVKRRQDARVVVVMDISGSMKDGNNYIKLAAAVKRYLLYTVQTGTSVGLVEYSDNAKQITSQLRKINSNADRVNLADLVIPKTNGATAIGKGLQEALKLLEAGNTDPSGDRIVLLTDGKENRDPRVRTVMPTLVQKGVIVDTILLTGNAAPILISLAAETGGLSFYSSGAEDSTSLSDAYTKAERDRITDSRLIPVTVHSKVTEVQGKNQSCFSVLIDSTLGQDSTFTFTWVSSQNLIINISAPNGTLFQPRTSNSRVETGYRCVGICPTGQWGICIENRGNQSENIISQVESTAANTAGTEESTLPITVTTRIVNESPRFNVKGAKPVTVLATVAQGYSPVIGARVIAVLESPDLGDATVKIPLRDDGATADVVKDDGTYSAFIFNTEKKGKHTLSVTVEGVNGQTNIQKVVISNSQAASLPEPGDPITTQEVQLTAVNNLERSSLAGFIDVEDVAPKGMDFFDPARVIDLEVTHTSYEDSTVTLTWTAVGDDIDVGRAFEYYLWKSDNHRALLDADLSNATQVNSSEVITGSLQNASLPYQRESVTVTLLSRDVAVVFGIIVSDEAGNRSPMSNLVATKPIFVEAAETSSNLTIILAATIPSAVILIIIIIVVVVVPKLRKSSKMLTGDTHVNRGYVA